MPVVGGRATALICNVGDSRVYRFTAAGVLEQCTLDDSPFGSNWELQLRLSEVVMPSGLLEYTYFEQRHVMDHALGERLASPHLWEVVVDDGDVLLAVSDGVTDNLTFSELGRLLHAVVDNPVDISQRIVDAASAVATTSDIREPRSTTSPSSLPGSDAACRPTAEALLRRQTQSRPPDRRRS